MIFRISGDVHGVDLFAHRDKCAFWIRAGYADELFGIWIWQRMENNSIDQAEDGGGGSDAESEREHGDRGKSRSLPQSARGVTQILYERFQKAQSLFVAALFLGLFDSTKL